MKLFKVKEKLEKKQIKKRGIKKEYKNNINSKRNDLKIIGITGSRGNYGINDS